MAQWLLLLGIAMFLVLLMFIVLLMLSVSRRVLRSGEYHNPLMPDAKHPVLPPMPNVTNAPVKAHVGKPRRDTTTRPVPKVGQPADSPNFSVPPRQAAAPSPAGRSAPPPVILNEAAREVAETGINIDAARMILTVFSRIRSIDEIPPVMRKEFERIGMDRAVMNELLGLSLAARSCAAFDFSQLRTLKPQTGHVLYRAMQKVQEAAVPAEE